MLDQSPSRPSRRGSLDYDVIPGSDVDCRTEETMRIEMAWRSPTAEGFSNDKITLFCNRDLKRLDSKSRFDPASYRTHCSPEKDTLVRRIKKSNSIRQSTRKQALPLELPGDVRMKKKESAKILKETYESLGLNYTNGEYKVLKVKSKSAASSDSPSGHRSPSSSRSQQPRRTLSCPKINVEGMETKESPKKSNSPESTGPAPRRRTLVKKSRSCPRNLGVLLPTIGEGEVLSSESDELSQSSSVDLLESSCHSSGRKGSRREMRSILAKPMLSMSCRTIGSDSNTAIHKKESTATVSQKSPSKIKSPVRLDKSSKFDRFRSYEPPKADAGPSSIRPLTRTNSMEPPKAPTRIMSPLANSNRKTAAR